MFESNEIIVTNVSDLFNGQMLIIIVTIITFLGLTFITKKLTKKSKKKKQSLEQEKHHSSKSFLTSLSSTSKSSQLEIIKPLTLSMMVAIGIGLHNFGEGLAIGSTILIGEIALSTFLIIGFTIHNTTEGLAIIFPLAKSQKKKYWKTSHSRSNCRSSHYFRNMDRRFSVLSYCDSYLYSHRFRIYIQVVYQIYSWFSSSSLYAAEGKKVYDDGYIISGFLWV